MKEKILQRLKQVFKDKFGVSDDVYLGLAEALAATGGVTDDNLETVILGQESLLKAYQTNFDRLNKEKSTLSEELKETKLKLPIEKKEDKTDIKPLTAEDIAAIIQPLVDKVLGFETNTLAEKRNAEIAIKAKGFGIPESLVTRMNIPADADLDEYFKEVQQEFTNAGYEGVKSPENGKGHDTNSNEVAALINRGTEQIVKSKI